MAKDLSRRGFLGKVAAAAAALICKDVLPFSGVLSAAASSYRGASFLPPAYRAVRLGVDGFVETLKRNAPPSTTIEFFDSGTLMKIDAQLPGLKIGTIQFMFHTSTYIADEFPILGVMELPGICDQLYDHGERLNMDSPLWRLINDELAKKNLFMLSAGGGILEPEFIYSRETKIASLEDLKGKRCRIVSPMATELLKAYGVTAVRLASSEILVALQRQSIDAVLSPVDTILARNLHGYLRYCYKLPVTGATHGAFLMRDVWDRMPEDDKAAFRQAGLWYDQFMGTMGYIKIPQEDYWSVLKRAGMEVVTPTAGEQEQFVRSAQSQWTAWKQLVGEEVGRRAIDLALGRP